MAATKLQSIREKMAATRTSWGHTIVSWTVAILVPLGIGLGISYAVERHKNGRAADKQTDIMASEYKVQIAAQLGMKDPNKVRGSHLKELAARDPKYAQIMKGITTELSNENRKSLLSNGAGVVAGGFINGGVGKLVASTAGSFVGGAAANVLKKEVLTVQDVVELIDEKMTNGQPASAYDLVMLKIAQDENFQIAFKSKYKKAFHLMTDEEKTVALQSMPEALVGVEKQTYALNQGLISPQSLVMNDAPTTAFAQNIAGPQRAGSFQARIDAERVAAAQQGRQVG